LSFLIGFTTIFNHFLYSLIAKCRNIPNRPFSFFYIVSPFSSLIASMHLIIIRKNCHHFCLVASGLFYPTQKLFSARRLIGGEKGPDSIPSSVLLSALLGNIYLHKLIQEIGRDQQKHEIPLVVKIRSVLLRIGRHSDDQRKVQKRSKLQCSLRQ
jgi:hypothetical protein